MYNTKGLVLLCVLLFRKPKKSYSTLTKINNTGVIKHFKTIIFLFKTKVFIKLLD